MTSIASMEKTAVKSVNNTQEAMGIIFEKLDEAIDDMENGRTLSGKEMWKKIEER